MCDDGKDKHSHEAWSQYSCGTCSTDNRQQQDQSNDRLQTTDRLFPENQIYQEHFVSQRTYQNQVWRYSISDDVDQFMFQEQKHITEPCIT